MSGPLACWPLASPFLSPRPILPRFLGKPPPPPLASASAASPRADRSSYSLFLCLRTLTSRNGEERIDREVRGRGGWGESGTARGPGRAGGGEEGWSSPALMTLAPATRGPHKGGPSKPPKEAILTLGLAGAARVYFPFVPSVVCRGRRVLSGWGWTEKGFPEAQPGAGKLPQAPQELLWVRSEKAWAGPNRVWLPPH